MNEGSKGQLLVIGKALKKLREDAKMGSYETFSIDNNLSRATVYRMESGKSNFRIENLIRILEVHNLTIEQFFKLL
jgi:predicted transcriptional regulator